jgi:hypothetical protein
VSATVDPVDELLDLPLPVALTRLFPPLGKYVPILDSLSDQQLEFLLDDGRESLYGGAVGGGKSAALLMGALQYVDMPGYAALLLRRTFAELSKAGGLIPLSIEWLGPTDANWRGTDKTWTFPSGATIEFGHCQNEADMTNYQGAAYTYVGFDELTHFSERIYDYIGFSRQRRKADLDVPIRTRTSANPGGVGHLWVKQRFITHRADDVLYIPAKVSDNPAWEPGEYEKSLMHLPEELRRQLMDGDWDAFEDAAFVLTEDHLVDGFPLADSIDRFEAADYGLNGAPWALIPVDYEGNLVFYDMLYEDNLLPSDLCPLVLAKRKAEWGFGHRAWMDPTVWQRTGTRNKWGQPAMLSDEFQDNQVPIFQATPDPRAGLIRMREMLKLDPAHPFPNWHPKAGQMNAPRIFFDRLRCARLVEELKSAPLQPIDKRDGGEIVDPTWESQHGHACAMARYAVMTRPSPSTEPDPWAGVPGPLRDVKIDADELRRELLRKAKARQNDRRGRFVDV